VCKYEPMKVILFFAFLSFCLLSHAHTFYVQDKAYNENASDLNRGTDINYPWATWQKAFNTAAAGDTVYFRGGTWYPRSDNYGNVTEHDPGSRRGHNGTAANPICFFAYPPDVAEGNMPILDCRHTHPSTIGHVGLKIDDARYLKFRGLTVTNVRSWPREDREMWCAGIMVDKSYHLTLEHMTASYVGGVGYFMSEHDSLFLINCDAHNNCDSLDLLLPGNDGDGFNLGDGDNTTDTSTYAFISGCRAWNNSDDGFNLVSRNHMIIENCWAFENGDLEGDATGFKLSYSRVKSTSQRKVHNCIAAANGTSGFVDLNLHADIGPFWEYSNNSAYANSVGFASGKGKVFDCDLHPALVIYRNNIAFASTGEYPATFKACDYQYPTYVVQDHNTWIQTGSYFHTEENPDYTVTAADFVSLDISQLRRPRNADGSLPSISFMRLNNGSDLVDGGIDVGLPYHGSAPDLGVFENGEFYVDLFTPVHESKYTLGDQIHLQAMSEDGENEVVAVHFYTENGSRLLGEGVPGNPSVWEYTWKSDTIGYQQIRAVAVNSQGETATSALVKILIAPEEGPGSEVTCKIIPNPNHGTFVLELASPLEADSNIHVFSMYGQRLATELMNKDEITKEFDFSGLGAGAYGLVFDGAGADQGCSQVKFIKF